MNAQRLLASLIAITSLVVLATAFVSADSVTSSATIQVDDMYVDMGFGQMNDVALIAGEKATIEVTFTADVDAREVVITAELDDNEVKTSRFDVEAGRRYKKTLEVVVPSDLDEDVSKAITLDVEIEGENEDGEEFDPYENRLSLTVQRPSYNPVVKSITVSNRVDAGDELSIEIVVKNIGYNDLKDIYVTAAIPTLGIDKTSYFGDLVADEWNYDEDDETDTVSGVFNIEVPYDTAAGTYAVEVTVKNDDTTVTETKQITVGNDFTTPVMKSGNSIIIVNPTDKVKVYTVVAELPATASESVVVVPAGESKTVTITPNAKGDYSFNVNVFSGQTLAGTVAFTGSAVAPKTTVTNPIIVLTVILAIVFLVLLVVLIVLIGKKPEKTEEFGESYY